MSSNRVDTRQQVATKTKNNTQLRRTAVEFDVLSPSEEKVVRMHYGIAVEDYTELTMVDELPGMPSDVVAQIRAIERRALETRGQLRPLDTKSKIVSALKKKGFRSE